MIPIYEQGTGHGIDHGLRSFLVRFESLCQEHLCDRRARAFAFIFYDFRDQDIRSILRDQGVFTQLDRLAASDISVFYLHSGKRRTITQFNADFMRHLGVDGNVSLPCVVFFRVKEDKIEDVAVAQLESANLIHGFHELYGIIERYIREELRDMPGEWKYLRLIKSGARFIGIELFRVLLRRTLSGNM